MHSPTNTSAQLFLITTATLLTLSIIAPHQLAFVTGQRQSNVVNQPGPYEYDASRQREPVVGPGTDRQGPPPPPPPPSEPSLHGRANVEPQQQQVQALVSQETPTTQRTTTDNTQRQEPAMDDDSTVMTSAMYEQLAFNSKQPDNVTSTFATNISSTSTLKEQPSETETTTTIAVAAAAATTTTKPASSTAKVPETNSTSPDTHPLDDRYFITAPPQSARFLSTLSPSHSNNSNQSNIHPLLIYSIRYEIRSFDLVTGSMATSRHTPASGGNSASGPSINSASIYPYHFGLRQSTSKTLIAGLKNTIGLDFYYSEQESYIFWVDVMEERIFRGTLANGIITNVNMIVQGGLSNAEGIAVDWVAKNIYWVESNLDHIEVANMNGTSRRTLIAGDMGSPRAIVVDPRYGLMFWTDWDSRRPRIERATMSGDDRQTLVDINQVSGDWPNGITLDYDALKIYWTDANSDSIHVVDYEGKNHKLLLQDRKIKSLGHPFAITLYENSLYWTDWMTNSISTANKHDGSEVKEVQRQQNRLFDIKLFHPSRQPKVDDHANPCSVNNGNCSHLCLLGVRGKRACECPHLMKLSPQDNLTCEVYEKALLIGHTHEIRAVDIAKPLHHIMAPITVPRVFSPKQFEYDAKSRSIFWVDSSMNEIKRSQLAGNNIETVIDVIIEMPTGLALDWISGNLFVSGSSIMRNGKIFISNLKGEFISILMDHHQGIVSPRSIAVHPLLGLLFCVDEIEEHPYVPLIFMATMDGQDKRVITSRQYDQTLENPTSLAIDYETDRVYWINQAFRPTYSASIQYYDIKLERIVTVYNDAEAPPDSKIHPGVLCVDGDHLIISSFGKVQSEEGIIRANKNNLTDRTVLKPQSMEPTILALRVYNASTQVGTNGCSVNNGGCSQLCIPVNATHRACKCTIGYNLNPLNETECVGKDLFLIYSNNQGMKGIGLEPQEEPWTSTEADYHLPHIHRAFRAASIDYVYRDNLIYWVDNEEGSITRVNRDTTNYQVIIQGLESDEYIAIDWVAGNIYWLDPYYDIIEVARLNGTNRYVIISGDMDKANGIVVNPLKGYIIWSDIGSTPKIERASLDGSNRRALVNARLAHIDDLAIDYLEDYVYWIDSTMSTIERVKADGTNRQVFYNGQTGNTPHSSQSQHLVAIALHANYLYVAEGSHEGSIIRFDKNNATNSKLVHQKLGEGIRDITVFAQQPLPDVEENPCLKDNGGCQDLCMYCGVKGKKRCICSHGKLKPDGLTCKPFDIFMMFSKLSQIDSLHIQNEGSHNNSPYPPIAMENRSSIISLTIDYDSQRVIYSDMTQDRIFSVFFNGTDKRVLVEKQSFVEGIAYNANQLYWTSIQDNSISRLNTDAMGELAQKCDDFGQCRPATVEKLVRLGPDDKPRGIAVDSCTNYIYWTNWNNKASIQRASPSFGFKVESIITTNIKVPNGIAIDQMRRKLYWCDARLDKIETCDMDGSNRIVLVSAMAQHPFALAVWDKYIFWTDWLARGVFRADKYTGQQAMQMKKVAQRPMGIAVASPDSYKCPVNLCTKDNGGCPMGETCETSMNENGQVQVVCHKPQEPAIHREKPGLRKRIYKTSCKPNGTVDHIVCEYVDAHMEIIHDELERFRPKDVSTSPSEDDMRLPPTGNSTSRDTSALTVATLPPVTTATAAATTTTTTTTTANASPEPVRSVSTPETAPTRDQVSTSTTSMPSTTTQPPTTWAPITPQAIRNSSSSSSSSSSIPQPCQNATSATTAPATHHDPNNDCRTSNDFKCYLSERLVCISNEKRCDGSYDCPNKEDETDCYLSSKGQQYNLKHESTWHKYVTVILIILAAALAALFLVFGNRGRRRWLVGSYTGFNDSKMYDDTDTTTNIEISNPFEDDDSAYLVHCAYTIDLNERTTNFSNPLYDRQALLVNKTSDKEPTS